MCDNTLYHMRCTCSDAVKLRQLPIQLVYHISIPWNCHVRLRCIIIKCNMLMKYLVEPTIPWRYIITPTNWSSYPCLRKILFDSEILYSTGTCSWMNKWHQSYKGLFVVIFVPHEITWAYDLLLTIYFHQMRRRKTISFWACCGDDISDKNVILDIQMPCIIFRYHTWPESVFKRHCIYDMSGSLK